MQDNQQMNHFTEDIQKEWDAFFFGVSKIHPSFIKENEKTEGKRNYVQQTIL